MGCWESKVHDYEKIKSLEDFNKETEENHDALIIDVRKSEEWSQCHLTNSINVNYSGKNEGFQFLKILEHVTYCKKFFIFAKDKQQTDECLKSLQDQKNPFKKKEHLIGYILNTDLKIENHITLTQKVVFYQPEFINNSNYINFKGIIIDARSEDEFKKGHMKGAINMSTLTLVEWFSSQKTRFNSILEAAFEANEIWVYCSKGDYASTLISLMLFSKFQAEKIFNIGGVQIFKNITLEQQK